MSSSPSLGAGLRLRVLGEVDDLELDALGLDGRFVDGPVRSMAPTTPGCTGSSAVPSSASADGGAGAAADEGDGDADGVQRWRAGGRCWGAWRLLRQGLGLPERWAAVVERPESRASRSVTERACPEPRGRRPAGRARASASACPARSDGPNAISAPAGRERRGTADAADDDGCRERGERGSSSRASRSRGRGPAPSLTSPIPMQPEIAVAGSRSPQPSAASGARSPCARRTAPAAAATPGSGSVIAFGSRRSTASMRASAGAGARRRGERHDGGRVGARVGEGRDHRRRERQPERVGAQERERPARGRRRERRLPAVPCDCVVTRPR